MRSALVLTLCLLGPGVAAAQEPVHDVTLKGELGAVSDYRFRGLSLSDEKPALQGGLTVNHRTGAYANLWASTIAEYGGGDQQDGAHVELDLSLGWAGAVAGLDVDAAAARYGYPGGHGVDYWEFPVSVTKAIGPASLSLQYAYAPAQRALEHSSNRYAAADLSLSPENWPLAATIHVGRESGAFAPGGKTDWSLKASRSFGPVEASLSYIAAHGASFDDDHTLVASLNAGF